MLKQRTPPAPIGARAALGVPRGLWRRATVRPVRAAPALALPRTVSRPDALVAPGAAEAASASAGVVGLRGWVAGHGAPLSAQSRTPSMSRRSSEQTLIGFGFGLGLGLGLGFGGHLLEARGVKVRVRAWSTP